MKAELSWRKTERQNSSVPARPTVMLQKWHSTAAFSTYIPSLYCVYNHSGHQGVKGQAESAQVIRLMHQVLTFHSTRRTASSWGTSPLTMPNPFGNYWPLLLCWLWSFLMVVSTCVTVCKMMKANLVSTSWLLNVCMALWHTQKKSTITSRTREKVDSNNEK